jgi:signal transduction histidine kinase
MGALLLVALVGVVAVVASRIAVEEAVHDATAGTRGLADALAAPLVDERVRAGDSVAIEKLGRVLENRMRTGSITHIVVYDEGGRVLWSEDEDLRSQTVELTSDVRALFGTRDVLVEDPDRSPWSQHAESEQIKVYAGALDADGAPFVLEAHHPSAPIDDDRAFILQSLVPIILGTLLLFLLGTLPLAIGLARRVDRAAASRSALLGQSLEALQADRHRLAQRLHDGVVQDLSAAGYTLAVLAEPGPGSDPLPQSVQETVRRLRDLMRDDIAQLRTLVTDLFPDELEDGNLIAAIKAVQSRSGERFGLDVRLEELAGLDDLDETTSALVFRVVREGLANVGRHAGAVTATVSVRRVGESDGELVVVAVADDGAGLSDSALRSVRDGHVGLRLLARQVESRGGHLHLSDAEGGGAVLTATIPVPSSRVV